MPNELRSLQIDEISLVDVCANASTDPKTGKKTPHARVAFFKRDSDPRTNQQKEQYMFEKILKSETVTRDQIVAAVQKRAAEIAREHDCSVAIAEKIIWEEHPELVQKYEATPKAINSRRPAPQLAQITMAEVELDKRARRIMKADNIGYPAAASKALCADPSLYKQYLDELAAGQTVIAPDPSRLDVPLDYVIKRATEAEADGVCAECDAPVDSDDSYCAACGSDLAAQHATKAKRAPKKRP
jgi:hypothetical protein